MSQPARFPFKGWIHFSRTKFRDNRIAPEALEQVNVQSANHREMRRDDMMRADTRQSRAPAWSERVPPTHFIALRVPPRSNLSRSIDAYRDELYAMEPQWAKWVIPSSKLHLTLGVVSLRTDDPAAQLEQMQRVSAIIDEASSCVKAMRLRFNGFGTFGNGRVLFAKPSADEECMQLRKLADAMRRELAAAGVDIKGNPHDTFTPHVTIAKVTPKMRKELGITTLPDRFYSLGRNDELGAAWLQNLDLCSMTDRHEDGYWKIHHRAALQAPGYSDRANATAS
jgi:2'-5' RNA ligase